MIPHAISGIKYLLALLFNYWSNKSLLYSLFKVPSKHMIHALCCLCLEVPQQKQEHSTIEL